MDTLNAICCCLGGKQPAPDVCQYLTLHSMRKAASCNVTPVTISGEGAALGTAAILQDRAFWEAKVEQLGTIRRHPRLLLRPGAAHGVVPRCCQATLRLALPTIVSI